MKIKYFQFQALTSLMSKPEIENNLFSFQALTSAWFFSFRVSVIENVNLSLKPEPVKPEIETSNENPKLRSKPEVKT